MPQKRVKILFVLEAAGGGALKHLTYLLTRLDPQKFECAVVLSRNRKDYNSSEVDKILKAKVEIIHLSLYRNLNPISDVYATIQLIKLLRFRKYKIVHAHSSKAGGVLRIAAWICKVEQVYYTPHCFYFQGKKGLKKKVFIQIEKVLSKISSALIVSENEMLELRKYNVAPEHKIVNINNAIDFSEYNRSVEVENTLKNLNIKPGAFIIGAVGRLVPQKDWNTFIRAANEVLKKKRNVVFIIVGGGVQYNKLEHLIYKLGLQSKVILTGYQTDINKLFALFDVYVNTSLWEGLPYTLLEALHHKKPVVVTNTGNHAIVENGNNGFVAPVKDYQAVANKITFMIENKEKARKMGDIGNKILTDKYSFERFIQQHEELYLMKSRTKKTIDALASQA